MDDADSRGPGGALDEDGIDVVARTGPPAIDAHGVVRSIPTGRPAFEATGEAA